MLDKYSDRCRLVHLFILILSVRRRCTIHLIGIMKEDTESNSIPTRYIFSFQMDVSFASFMIEDRVRDFYVHSHYSFPISDLSAKLLYIYLARVLIFVNLYIRVNKIRACIARMCVCTFVICVAVLIHILTCVIVYTCFARLWRCIKFTR